MSAAYETYEFVRIVQMIRIQSFICIYLYRREIDFGVPALRLKQNGDITRVGARKKSKLVEKKYWINR